MSRPEQRPQPAWTLPGKFGANIRRWRRLHKLGLERGPSPMFVCASYPTVSGSGHETGGQAANGCNPVKQVTKASDQKARYRSNDGNLYGRQAQRGLQEA